MNKQEQYQEPKSEVFEFSFEHFIAISLASAPTYHGMGEEQDWNSMD